MGNYQPFCFNMNEEINNLKELFYSEQYELCYQLMDGLGIKWFELDLVRMVNNKDDSECIRTVLIKNSNEKINILVNTNYSKPKCDGIDFQDYSKIVNNYTHLDIRFEYPCVYELQDEYIKYKDITSPVSKHEGSLYLEFFPRTELEKLIFNIRD